MREWLILKLGGYTRDTLNDWLEKKLTLQLLGLREVPELVEVFETKSGSYFVSVKFTKNRGNK